MSRTLLVLNLVLVSLCFILSTTPDALLLGCQASADAVGSHVLVVGDSIASGHGSDPRAAFPAVLARRLGIRVVNESGAGDTTADGVARLKQLLVDRPRVVVVELGVNDLLHPEVCTARNLDTMFRWIQGSGAVAVFLEVLPPGLRQRAPRWQAFCEERGVYHVRDLMGTIEGQSRLMFDVEHPNARGHLAIADRLEGIVRDSFMTGDG